MCFTLRQVGLHMVRHGVNFGVQKKQLNTSNINLKTAIYTKVYGDM